jgi:hypothetical protein
VRTVQKVVQALEDNLLPFTQEEVRRAVEKEGLREDPEAIAQEDLEEEQRRRPLGEKTDLGVDSVKG